MIKKFEIFENKEDIDPYHEEDWNEDENLQKCEVCGGTGAIPDIRIVPRCCGRGYYDDGYCCGNPEPEEDIVGLEPCRFCNGTGLV